MIQHIHRHGIHHSDLLRVIFEHKHHVEVLEVELYSLEVYQLDVL